jgi:PAS domain S-box-containing protein
MAKSLVRRSRVLEVKQCDEHNSTVCNCLPTLCNILPNPILIHSKGKVIYANDIITAVAGRMRDEVVGKFLAEILSGLNDLSGRSSFRNLLEKNFPDEEEIEICEHEQGTSVKNYLLRNSPIVYQGQNSILTILIDITERKQMEKFILNRVIETEEMDRKRFAADLHDDLGPILSSIKLHIEMLEYSKDPGKISNNLKLCNDQLTEAISKMKIISNNLMPRLIESYGLEASLKSFFKTMQVEDGEFTIDFISNLKDSRFKRQTELHLYRIICELTNNTIKHSGATVANVSLNYSGNKLTLHYSDNGKGYRMDHTGRENAGMGIGNILQRVNMIDGKIEFLHKGRKTAVRITKIFR